MKTKAVRDLKIVDEDKGLVKAVFATLNVKDHDGDVTLPGAFKDNPPIRISGWNHSAWQSGALPVGKGQISEQGELAVMDGQFFMDTTHGRDTFTTVKELGELAEWSYGYDTIEAKPGELNGEKVNLLHKQLVHEVSPVLLGAGLGTQTLAMKARKGDKLSDDELAEALKGFDLDQILKAYRGDAEGVKLTDELEQATTVVTAVVDRLDEVLTLRKADGKKLSDEAAERAQALLKSTERIREVLTIEPPIHPLWREAQALNAQALALMARGGLRS
jgi:hypothetical protein